MKIFIQIVLLTITLPLCLFAQESVIGIPPFTYEPSRVTEAEATQIYGEFVSEVMLVSPVAIAARSDVWDMVNGERELQEGGAFADASVIEKGRSLSANRLIVGHILNVDKSNFGIPNPVIHLCVVDVATSAIEYSSIISKVAATQLDATNDVPTGFLGMADEMSLIGNIDKVVKTMKLKRKDAMGIEIRNFFNECFPPQIPILALEEVKGDRAVSFTITGPTSLFQKNQQLEVIQWTTYMNVDRRIVLASARVTAIEGQVIVCKLGSNKEEQEAIFEKWEDDGVYVTTK